jgi:hypothetical protein
MRFYWLLMISLDRVQKNRDDWWSPDQVRLILRAGYARGRLFGVVFETLWLSGRRVGEVVGTRRNLVKKVSPEVVLKGLRLGDVDFRRQTVTWGIEKRRKVVYIKMIESPVLFLILEDWVKENKERLSLNDKLFDVYERKLERVLQDCLKELNLRGSLNTFRHSHAKLAKEFLSDDLACYRLQLKVWPKKSFRPQLYLDDLFGAL